MGTDGGEIISRHRRCLLTQIIICPGVPRGHERRQPWGPLAPSHIEKGQMEVTLAPGKCALFDWKVFGTRNRNGVSGTCFLHCYFNVLAFFLFMGV